MNKKAENSGFTLDKENECLVNGGVRAMCFSDFYPEGHQSGVIMTMYGKRALSNGDVRFEPTPGQWQPVPEKRERKAEKNTITQSLCLYDEKRDRKGFNPMLYPDYRAEYSVSIKPAGAGFEINVDLSEPVPPQYTGHLFFNAELFPGYVFGKSFIMDGKTGIFPRQPNGPESIRDSLSKKLIENGRKEKLRMYNISTESYSPMIADDIIASPYASGKRFTACPEDELLRFTVESRTGDIKLYDGRFNHNNGWFVLSTEIPAGKTKGAVSWIVTPNIISGWIAEPTIQVSQVGYHPGQPKRAVIELDVNDPLGKNTSGNIRGIASLCKLEENGEVSVKEAHPSFWGPFLGSNYAVFDFSEISKEGLYLIRFGTAKTHAFRIAKDVYDRGVWQPVLEYFLPVQMCHMRVSEKYRVWHDACHMDDGEMAAENLQLFDGYLQRKNTSKITCGKHVPGVNCGGWHDAGDYDLRIESQIGEMYYLAMIYDEFGLYYDSATIDQEAHRVEIHQPDGKNDILEQIEHGALSVLGGYRSLGQLYRGIICRDIRQYVLLGDASAMTDGKPGKASSSVLGKCADERLVFTEDNYGKDLTMAAQLAFSSKALKKLNPELASEALAAAEEIFEKRFCQKNPQAPAFIPPQFREAYLEGSVFNAAVDLYLATGKEKYKKLILSKKEFIKTTVSESGWMLCRLAGRKAFRNLLDELRPEFETLAEGIKETKKNPYGVFFYESHWGIAWQVENRAVRHYFLRKAFPDLFTGDFLFDSLNYILGCHPGKNTVSFASGIGANSQIPAYCANRADGGYIPGGVPSGTTVVKPDLPELLESGFLWQQGEYVLGGGSTRYLFMVQAVIKELRK